MQIHLPIHQASRIEKTLNIVYPFLFHDQLTLHYIEHGDDPVGTNCSLHDAGKKAVAVEVVQPVHVQLRADELMQEFF